MISNKKVYPSKNKETGSTSLGLTYREWLIGQVIKGLVANLNLVNNQDSLAQESISIADAVIKLLEKEEMQTSDENSHL
jgi:hypothetical protein